MKKAVLLICAMFMCVVLCAQETVSSVQGTVRDPQGHVLANATVVLSNEETGVSSSASTQKDGSFLFPNVQPGHYELQITSPGFQTEVQSNLNLLLGQKLVLNPTLKVGQINETVTVTTAPGVVDNSVDQISGLVGEREVKDLPLNGRSFDNLISLNPATVNSTGLKLAGASNSQTAGNDYSIAGRRPGETLFIWNGVEFSSATNDDNGTPGGASGELMGVDAVREFNVITTLDTAEVGHRVGGQVRVITKSGTNTIHGSAYDFVRNSAMDARNYFDPISGVPPFSRNQFGGSLGGPIRKDHAFLFGNYEAIRQELTVSSVAVVPDALARQGQLPNSCGVYSPVSGYNSAVAPYFALWPDPNDGELTQIAPSTCGAGIAGTHVPTGTAQSANLSPSPVREDFGTLRYDEQFGSRDSFVATYTVDDGTATTAEQNPEEELLAYLRTQMLTAQEIHTFTPNLLNTLTLGYTRPHLQHELPVRVTPPGVAPFVAGYPIGQFKIGGGSVGTSAITVAGSGPNTGSEQYEKDSFYTLQDQVQWVKGRHSFAFGGLAQHTRWTEYSLTYGQANFVSLTTFLQGKPSSIAVQLKQAYDPWTEYQGAWYIQDSIRIASNLTFSVGLRHEFTNGFNSANDTATNYILDGTGTVITAPKIGHSLFAQNNARFLFGPRVGLAWDPFKDGKTSVRIGYGMAYNLLDDIGYCCFSTPPSFASLTYTNPTFPFTVDPSAPVTGTSATPTGGGIQQNAQTPLVTMYRFEIERDLGFGTSLRVAYLGSNGNHSLTNVMENPKVPVTCPSVTVTCPAGVAAGTLYFPTTAVRKNTAIGPDTVVTTQGVNNYNGLALDLNRRFHEGLGLRATYTWSKSLDDSSNLASGQSTNNPGVVMNPFNLLQDYGPSAFDIRQRATFSSLYELPFGHGKAFGANASPVVNQLIAGWQANVIVGLQSGFPFTPEVGSNVSNDGNTSNPDRPNWAAGRNVSNVYTHTSKTVWFDGSAFVAAPAGTYGLVSRNVLNGPKLAEVDASIERDIRLSERFGVQFRAEFFNLPNHTNLGMPSLTAPASSAGLITATATSSRQIQLSGRLHW